MTTDQRAGPAPDEWAQLSAEWQEATPRVSFDPNPLRERVERDRRRMIGWVVADLGVSAVYIAASAFAMGRYPGPWSTFVAVDSLAMLVAVWAFGVWNARGLWKPLGETTEAFLSLARLRCTRRLRMLSYAALVTVMQVGVVWLWSQRVDAGRGAPQLPREMLVLPAAVIVGVAVGIVLLRRRTMRELAELRVLALGLTADR